MSGRRLVKKEREEIRSKTYSAMHCQIADPVSGCKCGLDMLITASGMLVCESGHGRLIVAPTCWVDRQEMESSTIQQLRAAWPERVIGESAGYREAMKAAE